MRWHGYALMLFALACLILICSAEQLNESAPKTETESKTDQTSGGLPTAADVNVLIWAKKTPIDWFSGIMFAMSGLVGALFAIFTVVGESVPGTAGKAGIDALTARLGSLYKIQDDMIKKLQEASTDKGKADSLENTINNLRDDLNSEKWQQFKLASILYVILGSFFALLLAQDVIQALLIGAGWTSYIGALGLKDENKERKAKKDEEIEKLRVDIKDLTDHNAELEATLNAAMKIIKKI